MKIRIDLNNRTRIGISKRPVERLFSALFKRFAGHPAVKRQMPRDLAFSHLSIVIVGEKTGRLINRKFRKKDYPTDILSFQPEGTWRGLGELVLCGPVIRRQARQHNLSFKHEMEYLLIHGFLHLLGYDHERSRRAEAVMMKIQDDLFEALCFRQKGHNKKAKRIVGRER